MPRRMRLILVTLQDDEDKTYLFIFAVPYPLPERICSGQKILGNKRMFSVWIGQCFEYICKAVHTKYGTVRGLTHSFPCRSSRTSSAMTINFPIFLTISLTVAHLSHQFLTLSCPSINSSQEERGDPPLSMSPHTHCGIDGKNHAHL